MSELPLEENAKKNMGFQVDIIVFLSMSMMYK